MSTLLEAYRSLWNNRALSGPQPEEERLREAIQRELKDEFAHPRVRKSKQEKFYLATKRIIMSDLSASEKTELVRLHLEEYERIQQQK